MSSEKNIFDFLHSSKGINQDMAFDFVVQLIKLNLPKFAEQLVSFLQDADKNAMTQLNILAASLPLFVDPKILRKFEVDDKCGLLSALKKVGFATIQKDLLDQQTSIVFRRKLVDILIDQTKKIGAEIQKIKDEFKKVEDEIKNIPPITYHVVFSTSSTNEIYPQSFHTLAEAKDFILNQEEKHKGSLINYSNIECNYFVLEIQAEEGSNEFNNAKKSITDLNSIPYPQNDDPWPDSNINSISWVAQRKKNEEPHGKISSEQCFKTLKQVEAERLYNPTGSDSVARTIKQLDSMIERLQKSNWVWKIVDALIEAVTNQPSLTNKKILALKEIRNDVLEHTHDIENNVISLRNVLNKGLNKETSPTITIKNLLHTHRFFGMKENTHSDDAFDELLNATRPNLKPSNDQTT